MSTTAIDKQNFNFHAGQSKKDPDISALVALCLFAFLMLAALLMIKNYNGFAPKVTNFFTQIRKQQNDQFQIGDFKLGTSLASLQAKRPDVMGGVNARGQIVASYLDSGARYTAWYGRDGETIFSYRARYDTILNDIDEEAVVYEIISAHGAPSTDSCNARITDGMRACKYSWWLGKGQRLDLATRTPTDGSDILKVTMIATDTRLQRRALQSPKGVNNY
ncbi:MAG: hypothetical protein KAI73_02040 [Rhodospirillaceae bacterium]|nr:hypothetical protein [Rhodospirillaceae bacterium]